MKNDWRHLDVYNLEHDLFKIEKYEFKYNDGIGYDWVEIEQIIDLTMAINNTIASKNRNKNIWKIKYRKAEPKPPTHEELAHIYISNEKPFIPNEIKHSHSLSSKYVRQIIKAFIAGRESVKDNPC